MAFDQSQFNLVHSINSSFRFSFCFIVNNNQNWWLSSKSSILVLRSTSHFSFFLVKGLPNLETLSIINTGLKVIQAHGFRHLTRLKHLRIESNRHLTELKSFALSNIHHIEHLSLRSNAIQKIHAEVFRNTYSVNVLDLSDNPLEVSRSSIIFMWTKTENIVIIDQNRSIFLLLRIDHRILCIYSASFGRKSDSLR